MQFITTQKRITAFLILAVLTISSVSFSTESDVTQKNSSSLESNKLKVVFLNPEYPDKDTFWNYCGLLMQAAASDLGVELETHHLSRSQATTIKIVDDILAGDDLPNFILAQNMKGTARDIIEKASVKSVNVFLFNSGLSPRDQKILGMPRGKYKNWIGELLPDDEFAGYELAKVLFLSAKKKKLFNDSGKIEFIALGGNVSDTSAIKREQGLLRFVEEHKEEIVLHRNKTLPANWSSRIAEKILTKALNYFPNTSVIWAANDDMGIGGISAIKEKNIKQPGEDILIGSVDWTKDAIEAVISGELEVSMGGHFSECSWAMILLYDYFNGIDFSEKNGTSMSSSFVSLAQTRIKNVLPFIRGNRKEQLDKVNFRTFSKVLNPEAKEYQFSFRPIIEQVE